MNDLPNHTNYVTNELRVKHRHKLIEIIETQMKLKTNSEWSQIMEGAKFPYGPVNTLKDVFEDPQVVHNQMVREMHHDSLGKIIKQVNFSDRFIRNLTVFYWKFTRINHKFI